MQVKTHLDQWDWRWRVPFDGELDELLLSAERDIRRDGYSAQATVLSELREHAHRHASLGGLLAALEEEQSPEKRGALIDAAENITLNGTPQFLYLSMERRILEIARNGNEASRLHGLLQGTKSRPWREPHTDALAIVFGDRLRDVMTAGRRVREAAAPSTPLGSTIPRDGVEEAVARFCAKHPELRPRIPDFALAVRDRPGFAAYWPCELAGLSTDRLDISANSDSLRSAVFTQTLAHEIAGHGVYYEGVRRAAPAFVDHGALALTEGWATFAEWRLPELPGPDKARLAWLDLLGADQEEIRTQVPRLVQAQGYSDSQVEVALVTWMQMPAFQASYLLGGLWFVMRAGTFDEGLALLDNIMEQPVGDFLGIY